MTDHRLRQVAEFSTLAAGSASNREIGDYAVLIDNPEPPPGRSERNAMARSTRRKTTTACTWAGFASNAAAVDNMSNISYYLTTCQICRAGNKEAVEEGFAWHEGRPGD